MGPCSLHYRVAAASFVANTPPTITGYQWCTRRSQFSSRCRPNIVDEEDTQRKYVGRFAMGGLSERIDRASKLSNIGRGLLEQSNSSQVALCTGSAYSRNFLKVTIRKRAKDRMLPPTSPWSLQESRSQSQPLREILGRLAPE